MGCGPSTPNNSQANSLATLSAGDASRPTSKTASTARNKSLESVLRDNDDNRVGSRTSNRDSGIDSAKTSDGRRRQDPTNAHDQGDTGGLSNNNNPNAQQKTTKALAFEVMVDNDDEVKEGESIIAKHPPRRLQKLDLRREPTLTAEMIEEKQRATEERRRQALSERAKSSKKSSKRRKELILAMQFGGLQDNAETKKKLDDKIDSASKNRAKVQADVISKQKRRELRAKQAKERARRMQEEENMDQSFDVEKDENFMADDDVDSWLDGENNTGMGSASTTSERIYNGRSSPMKKLSNAGKKVGQSMDFDSDGEEEQGWATNSHGAGKAVNKDAFFDD